MEKLFLIDGDEVRVSDIQRDDSSITFKINDKTFSYNLDTDGNIFSDGRALRYKSNENNEILYNRMIHKVTKVNRNKRQKSKVQEKGSMISPMPGKIFKILCREGDEVKIGDTILILEAMKMEHSVKAANNGVISKIFYQTGELVDGGVPLVAITEGE